MSADREPGAAMRSPSNALGRGVANMDDIEAFERAAPLEGRLPPGGVWTLLEAAGKRHADRPALSFLPNGDPDEPAETWTHAQLLMQCRRLANWLHAQGVAQQAGVAVLLPNLPQTYFALFGSQAVAVVCPSAPRWAPLR